MIGFRILLMAMAGHSLMSSPCSSEEGRFEDSRITSSNATTVVNSGYVFINGHYLSVPYEVTESPDGTGVVINGETVPGELTVGRMQHGFGEGRGPAFRRLRGADGGNRFGPHRMAARVIAARLADDSVIIAFDDEPLVVFESGLDYPFLKILLDPGRSPDDFQQLRDELSPSPTFRWESWLLEYDMPPELRLRAEAIVAQYDEVLAGNVSENAAVRRYASVGYPLTVLGMVIAVLALGHLLMSSPGKFPTVETSGPSAEIIRATIVSLVLIAVLSSLDLIWTLLASQAGQMRELNPIGDRLISDPQALIGFKLAATVVGCGLLYAMRKHGRAQIASWWLCLVCTVLTFRWLMFNSMFMA